MVASRPVVSATAYFATYSNEISNSDHAVLYGYDERGNVELLVRYTKGLIPLNQQFKSVHYRFDQLSGKVNEVIYQEAKPDQYVHHYEYDAENRLVKSYSSTRLEAIHESAIDGLRPGLDAAYAYYLHGPLARTELGEIKVQGVDYAYTIMGWLKAVNSDQINAANDMGKDGFNGTLGGTTFTSDFPLDEMGFSLHYFEGDYAPVLKQNDGSSAEALHNAILQYPSFSALPTSLNATSPSLYNGNISRMITAIRQFSSPSPSLVSAYQYDQLNRITAANYHYLSANNTLTATEDWKNTFTYDANGNILSQFRNASGSNREMDDLKYFYKAYDKTNANAIITYSYTSSGALVNASGMPLDDSQFDLTNQLSYVTDSKGSGTHSDDIDNQSNSFTTRIIHSNFVMRAKRPKKLAVSRVRHTILGMLSERNGQFHRHFGQ